MPLIQGGPPQWIWERTADLAKFEMVPVMSQENGTVYELRVNCGMEIVRLQFFTDEEIEQLSQQLSEVAEAD